VVANHLVDLLATVKAWVPLAKQYAPAVLWGLGGCMVLSLMLKRVCGQRSQARDAQWASRRDLRKAYLLGEVGIVLGRIGGLIVRYWGRGHVFVVAATQSGKTQSVVIPTLLEEQPRKGPRVTMIIHDPKGELHPMTVRHRRTVSRVVHLAPMDPATDHYNPLDALDIGGPNETATLQLFSKLLVNPEGKPISSEASQHYVDMTEIVVRGLTVFGVKTGLATSLGEFYILTTQGGLLKTFKDMSRINHPATRQAAELIQAMDEKQYDGLVTTLMRVYQLYGDPLIGEMVSYSDFLVDELRQGAEPLSVYLSIPFAHLERCRPMTCLFFNQWLGRCTEVPPTWRTQGWHRVLCLGEEFPSLKHLTIARDILNQGAGLGVQLCLITPSLNDIEAIWGVHHNFLDNAHVQVFFGISDVPIAQRLSTRLGTRTVQKRRVTWQGGRRSVTEETVKEPLLDTSAILHSDPNDLIVLARKHQTIVEQTPWHQCAPWKTRGDAAV
jgi:type IV secretion system protein VirD4